DLTPAVALALPVPWLASGRLGTLQKLAVRITAGGADAVLAASIFHYGQFTVRQAKEYLAAQGIAMRLE
ncbi:MAG: imidazole glycerol phosphate synthase subunit HisF, partial [Betaproteobacteria bacterium]